MIRNAPEPIKPGDTAEPVRFHQFSLETEGIVINVHRVETWRERRPGIRASLLADVPLVKAYWGILGHTGAFWGGAF